MIPYRLTLSLQVYEQCFVNNLPDTKAGPVNFTLYFESLCPDCQNFFKRQLHHTYMTLGETVMNLTLVPYGNARVSEQDLEKRMGIN